MNAHARVFEAKQAERQKVPLLIGLVGPSGGGKTYSALRLAKGMQEVTGGDIYMIDTEAKRSLHYVDQFKFKHIEFLPPFGSLDYLAAMQFAVKQGAGTIIVDSMSHEHEGQGGYLFTHAAEIDRLAKDDVAKRERVKFTAWIKPAAERRALINGMLQLNANFIFCFRAKDKLKVVGGGQPVELGFMPIAGDEFVYEMTLSALLYPGARGIPTWNSRLPGERSMIKLPEQFRSMFTDERQMDEAAGKALATWAAGGSATPVPMNGESLFAAGKRIAATGTAEFVKWWNLPSTKREWPALRQALDEFKAIAKAADEAPPPADADPFNLPPVPVIGTVDVDAQQRAAEAEEIVDDGSAAERKAAVALRDKLRDTMMGMETEADLDEFVGAVEDQIARELPSDLAQSFNDAVDARRTKLKGKKR